MPFLDVSDILSDPDFASDFTCIRIDQDVGDDGMAKHTETEYYFTGVRIADAGAILKRTADSAYVSGSILIYTDFELRMEGDDVDADVVVDGKGRRYTVKNIGDYTDYGQGFVWAVCEPVRFAG